MQNHLVILKKRYLDAILAGEKTIESRFTRTKHLFLDSVSAGDRLFLKISSGPVCATAIVSSVKRFTDLTPPYIAELKERYNRHIRGNDEYWKSIADCKYGLLVWLKEVRTIKPVLIDKKDWRAWVVLTEKENFNLIFYSLSLSIKRPPA